VLPNGGQRDQIKGKREAVHVVEGGEPIIDPSNSFAAS
jgi:hypothetical protein